MTKTLTYHDFFEEFNAFSNYHACRSFLGSVIIVDNETGEEVAELFATVWNFFKPSAFDYNEMTLMARLATTLLGLRGGTNGETMKGDNNDGH